MIFSQLRVNGNFRLNPVKVSTTRVSQKSAFIELAKRLTVTPLAYEQIYLVVEPIEIINQFDIASSC